MAAKAPSDDSLTVVCPARPRGAAQRPRADIEPLVVQMRAAWDRDDRLYVEDLLAEHPELREDTEAVFQLLDHEISLRRRAGETVNLAEMFDRFPEYPRREPDRDADAAGRSFDLGADKNEFTDLVEQLIAELRQRWREGDRASAAELLYRHPELNAEPAAAAQVILEEVVLHREQGDTVAADELLQRFPQWEKQLRFLMEACDVVDHKPRMPAVHESLGDFFLLAELGKGAQGCVFLARHRTLADRQMVLKITPCEGREHLSLARLQHTHIAPLYSVEDWPKRRLRALVFPYLGRVTWKHLLKELKGIPVEQRSGKRVLEILDRAEVRVADALAAAEPSPSAEFAAAAAASQESPSRKLLRQESYVALVCRIGACLAETLQYAHERGLVHLDVKPSNVLMAGDGQPLLLDFHLAHAPLEKGNAVGGLVGGTPGYMAPEQEKAFYAVRERQPIPERVDGRADIFALGTLLYESLSGKPLAAHTPLRPLCACNAHVSLGLSDIVGKCLAPRAEDRYASAADLAEDLRRHREDRPLQGVANRSLVERWRKWRRRRPYLLPVTLLAVALLGAVASAGFLWANQRYERYQAAEKSLLEGQSLMNQHRYADAVRSLKRGEDLLADRAPTSSLARSLAAHGRIAERARRAQELHMHADALRFLYVAENLSPRLAYILEAHCQKVWNDRGSLLDRKQAPLEAKVEDTLKSDLLDLVVCLSDFRVRSRQGKEADAMRREALTNLEGAESQFGASPVLLRERQRHARALGLEETARDAERRAAAVTARTAWDHYALGMSLLRSGEVARASAELEQAHKQQPHAFWTNFCQGVCAQKLGRHQDAVEFFSVCVGQFPQYPECFMQRGQAYAALGKNERAHRDLSRALELRPEHAEACLLRGILECEHDQIEAGLADLLRARDLGADPAQVHYYLAGARWMLGDVAGARADVATALGHRADYAPAQALQELLGKVQ